MKDFFTSMGVNQNAPFYDQLSYSNRFYSQNSQYQGKKERCELFSIIGIGDPIVDITSEVDDDLIRKYNLKGGDTIFLDESENAQIFDEIERLPEVRYIPGGSVQNTLRVLSWCLNMNSNNRNKFHLTMLGCVGEDIYKLKIVNALKELNVYPLFQISPNDKTSRCGVGIYKKERFLITQLRASKNISEDFIQQNLNKILLNEAIIIEGYILQKKLEMCSKLCDYFNQEKKVVILTLGAIFMVQIHRSKILEIANKSDIIVGNIEEAEEFAQTRGNNIKETFETIFRQLTPKDRLLVFTAGLCGVYCSKYDFKRNKVDFILQVFPKKLKNEEIVDLNGAGDAFLGGFLSEYIKGNSVYDCCKIGCQASNVILHNVGCSFPKNMKFEDI